MERADRLLQQSDGHVIDTRPGVPVRPDAGEDDERGVRAAVHRGGHARVTVETEEALLADDLAAERAQTEVAVVVVRRGAYPRRDRVTAVGLDADCLMQVVPSGRVAHPAVASARACEAGTVV